MAVKIGDTFRSPYADGNPLWKVTRRSGKTAVIAVSQVEYFTLSDGREIEGDYAGIEKAFTLREVERAKGLATMFNRLVTEQDRFFDSLSVGDIVHYNDGFANFVRCEIVIGTPENVGGLNPSEYIGQKVMQPIALVGKWREYDLPCRRPDGTVELGYHAEKIVNRTGAWQANVSCIFEAPSYSSNYSRRGIDPTTLPAIDLSLPEMTPAEQEVAAAEQLRAALIADLQNAADASSGVEDAKRRLGWV